MVALLAAFLMPVVVDGSGPYRFLIDTGAESSVIFPGHGPQVRPEFRTKVQTVNGEILVPGGYVQIKAGDVRLQHVEVLLYGLPIAGVDGVLGQSALRSLDYTIGKVKGTSQSMELRYRDGRIVVPAKVDGHSVTLLLDSGASDVILFRPIIPATGTVLMTTATGQSSVLAGKIRELKVAGRVRTNVQAAIVSPVQERDVDGLLPASLFRAIKVLNSEGKLILE